MPTLTQVRTRVDAWLADKWPTVVARQQNYFANRGKYWQGLKTHTIDPAHTNGADGDSVADQLEVNLHDQFENWKTVFPEWDGVAIPAAVVVDVYQAEAGHGWCATLYIRFNGTLYSRSQNVGPESSRTKAWHVVGETANPFS